MLKKTVIKRASKLWPKSERIQQAVEVINEHEGIDFSKGPSIDRDAYLSEAPKEDQVELIRSALIQKGKSEEGLIDYLKTQFKDQDIESLEKLDNAQIVYAKRILGVK
jgi:recombination protein RecT